MEHGGKGYTYVREQVDADFAEADDEFPQGQGLSGLEAFKWDVFTSWNWRRFDGLYPYGQTVAGRFTFESAADQGNLKIQVFLCMHYPMDTVLAARSCEWSWHSQYDMH